MSIKIQVFDFSAPLPSSSDIPLAYQSGFSFASATQTAIYLDESDGNFETATTFTEPGQKLLIDTELGGTVLSEGTVLTFRSTKTTLILDTVTNDYYYVFFPYRAGSSANSPVMVGDKSTVLVIPMTTTTPPLDPSHLFDFVSPSSSSSYAVAQTAIPPSYLNPTCFATGTLIDTANGPRAVETLVAGDLVLTRDGGLRPLAWVGGRYLGPRHLDIAPNLRPIRIKAGALGEGLPATDLTVSPQHRLLVRSKIAERICGTPEALVAAKHLCALPGIEVICPAKGIGYYHLLFDQHEIVRSNGAWTESLFTGPQALKSVGPAAQREIRAIFPELFSGTGAGWTGARSFLSGQDARELARRHLKNEKPLVV